MEKQKQAYQMILVQIIHGLVMKKFRPGDEVTATDFPVRLEFVSDGQIRVTWLDTGEVETWTRRPATE